MARIADGGKNALDVYNDGGDTRTNSIEVVLIHIEE